MTKMERAKQFAHEAHDSIKQVRKYDLSPYWTHTDAVAAQVAASGGDEDMVCAAENHDVLEDVFPLNPYYSEVKIRELFGDTVANYVIELTDVFTKENYPDKNRTERKALECNRLSKISKGAKLIKICDLIHNTGSIVENDKGFAKTYLKEKLAILPHFANDVPSDLLQQASIQVIQGFEAIGMKMKPIQSPCLR